VAIGNTGKEVKRTAKKPDNFDKTRVGSDREGERVATWQPWLGWMETLQKTFEEWTSVTTTQLQRYGSKEWENQM
jgi:hypothetical protein